MSSLVVTIWLIVGSNLQTQTSAPAVTSCHVNELVGWFDFSPDSQYLLSNWNAGEARLWDVETGEFVASFQDDFEQPFGNTQVAFSPDGTKIATGIARPGHATVWDVPTGQRLYTFPRDVQDDVYTFVQFSTSGQYLFTSGYDGASLWDLKTGTRVHTFASSVQDYSLWQYASLSHNERYVITVDQDDVNLWDAVTGDKIHIFEQQQAATFSPDTTGILTANKQTLTLWDIETLDMKQQFQIAAAQSQWQFSPDSQYLLVTLRTEPRTVSLWNVETGKRIHEFGEEIGKAFFSPGSDYVWMLSDWLASNDENYSQVLKWDLATHSGQQLTFEFDITWPSAISPNGRYWAFYAYDTSSTPTEGSLQILDMETLTRRQLC